MECIYKQRHKLETSIFEGSKIRNKQIEQISSNIYNTITFKVGKLLCFPFSYFKKVIKLKNG